MQTKFVKLNANKQPMTKLNITYDSPNNLENAGLLLNDNVVLVDFDNDNATEERIIQYLKTTYPTQIIETNRGYHFYYSKPKDVNIKNGADKITVGGFQVDYKTGNKSYAVIKLNGELRKINQHLTLDNLPELPILLYPLRSKNNITGLLDGEGRNDALFCHLMLVKEQYEDINISDIAYIINVISFEEPLQQRETESVIKSVANRDSANSDIYYGDKKNIVEFAKYLVKKLDIKLYNDSLYIKSELSYVSNDNLFQREANKYLVLNRQQFSELKHQLVNYAKMIPSDKAFKVRIRNGYIENDKVIECDNEFTPFYLDVLYDSNAYDKEVDEFLNFISHDRKDMRILIEEIIGHTLMISGYPAHVFFLTGNGANGKSTFVNMLNNFTGELSSNVDISRFSDGTSLLELKDKLVNIADDIDNTFIDKAKYLKTLASGDKISERAIYAKQTKMTNTATLIFTANEMPYFKDKSGGIKRRIKIIPFDNEVKVRDPKIIDSLSSDSAKSYILKLGLHGISRIIANDYQLSSSKTIDEATKQYLSASDSIADYITKHPDIHNKTTSDVYSSYIEFCDELDIHPEKKETFSKRLNVLGYSVKNTTLMGKKIKFYVERIH